jgi:hypothetical protein
VYSDRWSLRRYAYGAAVVPQQATFFRRAALLRAGGFNEENRTCWDGELLVDMARAGGRFHRLGAFLGAFRLHPESISGSERFHAQYVEDTRRIFRKIQGRDWAGRDRFLLFPLWKAIRKLEQAARPVTARER